MLRVTLSLFRVAAMLFGIELPEFNIELDSSNGPTTRPFPSG